MSTETNLRFYMKIEMNLLSFLHKNLSKKIKYFTENKQIFQKQ